MRLATNCTPDEEMMKTFRHCLKKSLHNVTQAPRMESVKSFSSYVKVMYQSRYNFGCHMTPAEFYVSSDALVHFQISTGYLSKSCRTFGWMP